MKTKIFLLSLLVISSASLFPNAESRMSISPDNHLGKIEWGEKCIGAAGVGTVRVIDPDMNHNFDRSDFFIIQVEVEQLNPKAWIQPDSTTIDITVTEIGISTGIFEGTVFFATPGEAGGHRLAVWEGDRVVAKYLDKTLPDENTSAELAAYATIDFLYKPLHEHKQRYSNSQYTYNPCIASVLEITSKEKQNISWLDMEVLPPIKQIRYGLDFDEILCRENLKLMTKSDAAACVKPESVSKLSARGWTLGTQIALDMSSSDFYPYQTLIDNYKENKIILLGEVISFTSNPHPQLNKYEIKTETNYKNQRFAVITAYGSGERDDLSYDPTFESGDRVFLYINQRDGKYMIEDFSTKLDFDCSADGMIPPRSMLDPDYFSHGIALRNPLSVEGDNEDGMISLGDEPLMGFVTESHFPATKTEHVQIEIADPNGDVAFSKEISLPAPGCYSKTPFTWKFLPEMSGDYQIRIVYNTEMHLDHYSIMSDGRIFNDVLQVK